MPPPVKSSVAKKKAFTRGKLPAKLDGAQVLAFAQESYEAEDVAMSILTTIINNSAKELHKHAMMEKARVLCAMNTLKHALEGIEMKWYFHDEEESPPKGEDGKYVKDVNWECEDEPSCCSIERLARGANRVEPVGHVKVPIFSKTGLPAASDSKDPATKIKSIMNATQAARNKLVINEHPVVYTVSNPISPEEQAADRLREEMLRLQARERKVKARLEKLRQVEEEEKLAFAKAEAHFKGKDYTVENGKAILIKHIPPEKLPSSTIVTKASIVDLKPSEDEGRGDVSTTLKTRAKPIKKVKDEYFVEAEPSSDLSSIIELVPGVGIREGSRLKAVPRNAKDVKDMTRAQFKEMMMNHNEAGFESALRAPSAPHQGMSKAKSGTAIALERALDRPQSTSGQGTRPLPLSEGTAINPSTGIPAKRNNYMRPEVPQLSEQGTSINTSAGSPAKRNNYTRPEVPQMSEQDVLRQHQRKVAMGSLTRMPRDRPYLHLSTGPGLRIRLPAPLAMGQTTGHGRLPLISTPEEDRYRRSWGKDLSTTGKVVTTNSTRQYFS